MTNIELRFHINTTPESMKHLLLASGQLSANYWFKLNWTSVCFRNCMMTRHQKQFFSKFYKNTIKKSIIECKRKCQKQDKYKDGNQVCDALSWQALNQFNRTTNCAINGYINTESLLNLQIMVYFSPFSSFSFSSLEFLILCKHAYLL